MKHVLVSACLLYFLGGVGRADSLPIGGTSNATAGKTKIDHIPVRWFRQVEVGMTKERVLSILGRKADYIEDGASFWWSGAYGIRLKFDEDGRVSGRGSLFITRRD